MLSPVFTSHLPVGKSIEHEATGDSAERVGLTRADREESVAVSRGGALFGSSARADPPAASSSANPSPALTNHTARKKMCITWLHRDGIAMSVQGLTNGTIEYTRSFTRRLAKPARPTAGLQRERCLARFVVSVKPAGGSPWRRRGSKATPRASKERQRGRLRDVDASLTQTIGPRALSAVILLPLS